MPNRPIRVTIWNEFVHERENSAVAAIYPNGIHGALEEALSKHGDFHVHTATLDEPEQGLSQYVLDQTDVLLWWGHAAHDQVLDETVTRVQERVLAGMGLIVLHSGHWSKVFKRLMGTSCALCWREAGERERSAGSTLVLDRTTARMLGDGSFVEEIHQVRRINDQTGVAGHEQQEAAARADRVLRLRTLRADGSSAVPKRVAGSYSMPGLEPGVFVEALYQLDADGPSGGPVRGPEFYFQGADESSFSCRGSRTSHSPTAGRTSSRRTRSK